MGALMPAVTADPLTLPRLAEPATGDVERPVATVTTAPSGLEGEGFPVRRAFAGGVGGHTGPGATHTPISFVHATVAPGARAYLPWPAELNALVYVLAGSGRAGPEGPSGRPVSAGQLAVYGPGDHLRVAADRR